MTACAHQPAPGLTLKLDVADRTPVPDPPKPRTIYYADPKPTGAEERRYLTETLVKPILDFTLIEAATTAAERKRADALVKKIDEFNRRAAPKRRKILGMF